MVSPEAKIGLKEPQQQWHQPTEISPHMSHQSICL